MHQDVVEKVDGKFQRPLLYTALACLSCVMMTVMLLAIFCSDNIEIMWMCHKLDASIKEHGSRDMWKGDFTESLTIAEEMMDRGLPEEVLSVLVHNVESRNNGGGKLTAMYMLLCIEDERATAGIPALMRVAHDKSEHPSHREDALFFAEELAKKYKVNLDESTVGQAVPDE